MTFPPYGYYIASRLGRENILNSKCSCAECIQLRRYTTEGLHFDQHLPESIYNAMAQEILYGHLQLATPTEALIMTLRGV